MSEKTEQRKLYAELGGLVGAQLCYWCKYGESQGCCDGFGCNHPLSESPTFPNDGGTCLGEDCWGFRRNGYTHDEIVDIVAVILQQGFDDWVVHRSKGGTIKIRGDKAVREEPKA